MQATLKSYAQITDFVTGRLIPDVGAEANRQTVERLLVNEKGFDKSDITVDAPIVVDAAGTRYRSRIDLVVSLEGTAYMAVKCAAGSLGSREREILAAARICDPQRQVPVSVVSDGKTAIVMDTVSGKTTGEGLAAIPTKDAARADLARRPAVVLDPQRRARENVIFRSYDMDNVNVVRETS